MFGDMGKMMKQVNEMKSQMKEVEKELTQLNIECKSKNDWVSCLVDGKLNVLSIKIKPEAVSNIELLERSVKEAVDKALNEAKQVSAKKLSAVTGGLKLPGMG